MIQWEQFYPGIYKWEESYRASIADGLLLAVVHKTYENHDVFEAKIVGANSSKVLKKKFDNPDEAKQACERLLLKLANGIIAVTEKQGENETTK